MESTDSAATEHAGERLGQRLRGGEILLLAGDLGSGKTTLVHGLARGIGSTATVTSPTFKLCNEYEGSALSLYHFDFYRLAEPGLMSQALGEITTNPLAVSVIEWPEIVRQQLPASSLVINLATVSPTKRRLTCLYPSAAAYLFSNVNLPAETASGKVGPAT